MATSSKTTVALPFQGGVQGYSQTSDGTFALDVSRMAGASDAAVALPVLGAFQGYRREDDGTFAMVVREV